MFNFDLIKNYFLIIEEKTMNSEKKIFSFRNLFMRTGVSPVRHGHVKWIFVQPRQLHGRVSKRHGRICVIHGCVFLGTGVCLGWTVQKRFTGRRVLPRAWNVTRACLGEDAAVSRRGHVVQRHGRVYHNGVPHNVHGRVVWTECVILKWNNVIKCLMRLNN